METDLSLIEISAEDDSLISTYHIPNDDVSMSNNTNNNSYFSCSPLLAVPRSTRCLLSSPVESMKGEEDACKPSSSFCEDSTESRISKENVNLMNRAEVPKLSIEPQQMKRKKKGGGYNLRKSLAWDRAFFTEEGVLDPLELSMLSGNLGKSSGKMLSVIHEGRESPSGGLDSASDSSDMPSSALNEGRKLAGPLSPKPGSLARHKIIPASAVKRKVLSAHDINRSASKRSGCPRPVASSSLKKPSSTSTTKVGTKDSKLSASRPDPSASSLTSRSSITSANRSKTDHISQSVNAQKKFRLKSTSSNTKTARNDAKSGTAGKLTAKPTAQQARRNVVMVSTIPSSNIQISQVMQSNNSSESIPAAAHLANRHDTNTSKNASRNASYNGGTVQHAQPQSAKPSGLRMPSPSLGFFGQSKSSGSHGLFQSTQSSSLLESNIPKFNKAGILNPIHQRPPRLSGNIPACSSRAYSVPSTVNAALCGKIKSNLESNNMQKVELQVKSNSGSYESFDIITHNQQLQLHNICEEADPLSADHAAPCKTEKISCVEHRALKSNSKSPVQTGACEQLEGDDDNSSIYNVCLRSREPTGSGLEYLKHTFPASLPVLVEVSSNTNNTPVIQHVEDRKYNPSIKDHNACSESHSADVNNNLDETVPKVHNYQLSSMHESKKQTHQQADLINPGTCKVDPISKMERQMLNGIFEQSRPSEDLIKCDSSKYADAGFKVKECGTTSCHLAHTLDVEPLNDDTTGIDYMCKELHAGDAQLQSVVDNLYVETGKSSMSTSAADNLNFMIVDGPSAKSAEEAELPNPCIVGPVFQDKCGQFLNGCYEESQEKDVFQRVNSVESRSNACGGEMGRLNVLFSIPPINQDSGLDAAWKTGGLHVENALTAFVEAESVVGNLKLDLDLCEEDNAFALERMGNNLQAEDNALVTNDPSAKSAEEADLPNPCLVEQVFQDNCGQPCNGCYEESKEKDLCQSVNSVESRSNFCGGKMASSTVIYSMPHANQDSGLDAGKAGGLHVENALTAFADAEPMAENFRRDFDLCGKVISGNVKVSNCCPNIGDLSNCELENPHLTSQISSVMQVKAASRMNEIREYDGVIDKQFDSSLTNSISFFDLQTANEACCSGRGNSIQHNDCSSFMLNVKEQSVEQPKLISSCCDELVNQSNEECDESRSIEDVNAIARNGSEISHEPHQCEIMETQLARFDNMIEGTVTEDVSVRSLSDSSYAFSCNSNFSTPVADKKSLLVVDHISRQPKEHPELFTCSDELVNQTNEACDDSRSLEDVNAVARNGSEISQGPHRCEIMENHRLCLDDNLLLSNTSEFQEKDNVENVSSFDLEQHSDFPSESKSYDACIQVLSSKHDIGFDVDRNAEYQCLEPPIEHIECYRDSKCRNDYELDNQAHPLNFGSSSTTNGNQMVLAANTFDSKPFHFLKENANVTTNGSIQLDVEIDLSESNILPKEAEVKIHPRDSDNNSDLQHGLDSVVYSEIVKDSTLLPKKSVIDKQQQDALAIKPPPNAVPFSDEWVAAFEAAGEEILARKSGAVQNSPPDKSLPEPGPWSPVKRKNNQGIGPHDCTKFTNTNIPSSTSD